MKMSFSLHKETEGGGLHLICDKSCVLSIKDPEIIQKMRVHAPGSVRGLIFGQNIQEISRSKMGSSSLSEQRYQHQHFTRPAPSVFKPPPHTNREHERHVLIRSALKML